VQVKAIYRKNSLKGLVLLSLFISLGISIIFVPELSKATTGIPAPISISRISGDYAVLPTPFTAGEKLCQVKPHKSDAYGKRVSTQNEVAFFGTYRYFISNLCGVSNYRSSFDSIFKENFQQACRLLDIPPPSDMIS